MYRAHEWPDLSSDVCERPYFGQGPTQIHQALARVLRASPGRTKELQGKPRVWTVMKGLLPPRWAARAAKTVMPGHLALAGP